jgi:hypothetical protein
LQAWPTWYAVHPYHTGYCLLYCRINLVSRKSGGTRLQGHWGQPLELLFIASCSPAMPTWFTRGPGFLRYVTVPTYSVLPGFQDPGEGGGGMSLQFVHIVHLRPCMHHCRSVLYRCCCPIDVITEVWRKADICCYYGAENP